jgi:signal recognition particle subunit SEC65
MPLDLPRNDEPEENAEEYRQPATLPEAKAEVQEHIRQGKRLPKIGAIEKLSADKTGRSFLCLGIDPPEKETPKPKVTKMAKKKSVKKSKLNKAEALRAAITKLYGAPPTDKAGQSKWSSDIESVAVTTAVEAAHGKQEWGTNPAAAVGAAKAALIKSGGGKANGTIKKKVAVPRRKATARGPAIRPETNGQDVFAALAFIEKVGSGGAREALAKAEKLIDKTGSTHNAKEIAELFGE